MHWEKSVPSNLFRIVVDWSLDTQVWLY